MSDVRPTIVTPRVVYATFAFAALVSLSAALTPRGGPADGWPMYLVAAVVVSFLIVSAVKVAYLAVRGGAARVWGAVK